MNDTTTDSLEAESQTCPCDQDKVKEWFTTRNIIIAVVALAVLIVVIAVAASVGNKPAASNPNGSPNSGNSSPNSIQKLSTWSKTDYILSHNGQASGLFVTITAKVLLEITGFTFFPGSNYQSTIMAVYTFPGKCTYIQAQNETGWKLNTIRTLGPYPYTYGSPEYKDTTVEYLLGYPIFMRANDVISLYITTLRPRVPDGQPPERTFLLVDYTNSGTNSRTGWTSLANPYLTIEPNYLAMGTYRDPFQNVRPRGEYPINAHAIHAGELWFKTLHASATMHPTQQPTLTPTVSLNTRQSLALWDDLDYLITYNAASSGVIMTLTAKLNVRIVGVKLYGSSNYVQTKISAFSRVGVCTLAQAQNSTGWVNNSVQVLGQFPNYSLKQLVEFLFDVPITMNQGEVYSLYIQMLYMPGQDGSSRSFQLVDYSKQHSFNHVGWLPQSQLDNPYMSVQPNFVAAGDYTTAFQNIRPRSGTAINANALLAGEILFERTA